MRILCVDVGTGTQDILLFDSEREIENCAQLVLPSPTVILAERIKQETARGNAILLDGVTMGGGPCVWAAGAHLRANYPLYATVEAARTFDDDLEVVAAMGVKLVSADETRHLQGVTRLICRDFYYEEIVATLAAFGAPTEFDGLAVAVFDHGNAPPGYSDRHFRFDYLRRFLAKGNNLASFAHRRNALPPELTRMQAVAASLPRAVRGLPLLLMDTGAAAALGTLDDPIVREAANSMSGAILLNVGNFHTLAFMLSGGQIMGLFEHHAGEIDGLQLAVYLSKLAAGSLSNEEIYNSKGHGALILQRPPSSETPPLCAVTGPRRAMIAGNWSNLHFPAPHGNMMLVGCYGLLRGYSYRYPDAADAIVARLAV
jgi:uncharacterized protein (DUF1786 family)